MEQTFDQHISDTAFLVNESRARRPDISLDTWARDWVPASSRQRVRRIWDEFAERVYPHDDLELSIRNRFFLDRINRFMRISPAGLFVNLGAGFTSYPYLMDAEADCREADFPHVIDYKQRRAARLMETGELPRRRVAYRALDLNAADTSDALTDWLAERLNSIPSFVLLEGVSYYLSIPVLLALAGTLRRMQTVGSVFAFDYWKPDAREQPVFQRLQAYFRTRFGFDVADYCLIGDDFIRSIPGYRVEKLTDVSEMEAVFAGSSILSDREKILPEHYAVLVRE